MSREWLAPKGYWKWRNSTDFVAVSLSNSQPDPQQNRWWGYRCQVNCYVTYQSFDLFVYVSYSNQTLWGVLLKSSQVVLLESLGSCWKLIQTTKYQFQSLILPYLFGNSQLNTIIKKKGRTSRTEEIPFPPPPEKKIIKMNNQKFWSRWPSWSAFRNSSTRAHDRN